MLIPAVLLALAIQAPDSLLRERLDLPTARAVEAIVDSAVRAGLPGRPLIQKALEGQTKGAAGPRIVAAVHLLYEGLGQARAALGSEAADDELQAGAIWLRSGGTVAQLIRMRRTAGTRPLTTVLTVSAEWLGRGWPAAEASASLERLLRADVPDTAFLTLRADVDRVARQGAAVLPVLRERVNRLAPVRNP
ncbi:MAG: hypothetical protein R2882_12840 [Gemmatimonadales bacterium]